jgi:alpha-glucosidase
MDSEKRYALLRTVPYFDRQGVHEIYRRWRELFNSYGAREVMAVAEAWVHPPVNATRYVRPDELHQVFNFDLLDAPFNAQHLYSVMNASIELMKSVETLPTWALSNHDSPRVASRLGEVESRALALFVLGLPGSCYVFAGQELGLPDGVIPDESRQDPIYFRTNGTQKGRDGARVPLPWSGESAPFGFTAGSPWLPLQESWKELTVEKQDSDPKSTLNLYRSALKLRAEHLVGNGEVEWIESPDHGSKSDSLLAYKRGNVSVYMNLANKPVEVEITGKLLIVSAGVVDGRDGKVTIPPVSTIWLHH